MYILKFSDHDCWIAEWDGDPGRTLVRDSARKFKSKKQAEKIAEKIIKDNSHRKFNLMTELY